MIEIENEIKFMLYTWARNRKDLRRVFQQGLELLQEQVGLLDRMKNIIEGIELMSAKDQAKLGLTEQQKPEDTPNLPALPGA